MLRIVKGLDDALEFRDWFLRQPSMAIDTETTGFDIYSPGFSVRIVQFGTTSEAWVLPMPDWSGLVGQLIEGYQGRIIMHNCFSADTEFLTSEGVRTLGSAVGETVKVLTKRQRWVDATVHHFGRQSLYRLNLRGGGRNGRTTKTVLTTAGHRWFRGPTREEVVTTSLRPGDRLMSMVARQGSRLTPSAYGIAAGIVYGDGTKYMGGSASKVCLFGTKEQLVKWFPHAPARTAVYKKGAVTALEVSNLPGFLKDPPPMRESNSYLLGWLAGYFATDGHISPQGQMTISSTDRSSLERVRDVCGRLGVGVSPIGCHGKRRTYQIGLHPETIPKNFFLRDDQETRYRVPDERGQMRDWVVESVEDTGQDDDVFCAVVPGYEAFTLADGLFTGNCRFDIEALAQHRVKVPWHKVDDTMIALRLAEPHRSAALKEAATRHVSGGAAQSQKDLHKAMKDNGWTWATVPVDFYPYVFYAALDTVLTARLAETPAIKAGLASPIYSMEMDVRQICTTMERNGMRIDTDFADRKREDLLAEAEHIKLFAKDTLGLDIMSPAKLAHWLMDKGAPISHVTPGGSPSASKEALEYVRPYVGAGVVAEVIDQALRVRKILKLANTYYGNFVDMSVDGLLHPSIETVAAKTGRQSIRNPALQTLPRVGADPDSTEVRNAVIPRNEGELLLACDYNQIELRCIANFGDPLLQEAFLRVDEAGGDFFTEVTREVYSDPTIPKGDNRRNIIKTLMYAYSYGAGTKKLAAGAGVTVEEMEDVKDRVLGRYPGMKTLMKTCERVAKENGNWIETPAGRKIWVDPDMGYKALNGLIQAHAADVFKRATVELAHAGLEPYMVVPVHDEMVLSVPEEEIPEVKAILAEVMPDHSMKVPLRAEPSDGHPRWGLIPK